METLPLNKWFEVLDCVCKNDKVPISRIARSIDVTYSHVVKIITKLENLKIITTKKQGRTRLVSIDSRNKLFASNVEAVVNFVKTKGVTLK